jgi:nucleoside permease NupC
LFIQQAVALFVLKSGAGFSIFKWIATLTSDFLSQSAAGAEFFFDTETIDKHWFFVNTVCAAHSMCQILTVHNLSQMSQLAAIIFFIAFIQMLYYVRQFLSYFLKVDIDMCQAGCDAMDYQVIVRHSAQCSSPFIYHYSLALGSFLRL